MSRVEEAKLVHQFVVQLSDIRAALEAQLPRSRELSCAITKLDEAKLWLSAITGHILAEYPRGEAAMWAAIHAAAAEADAPKP